MRYVFSKVNGIAGVISGIYMVIKPMQAILVAKCGDQDDFWPLAASDSRNVHLWFLNMKIPHKCG